MIDRDKRYEKLSNLYDVVKGLEESYRHAERMRRDMVERLEEVAEARDFWDSEASRIQVQIERYRSEIRSR